MGVLYHHRHNTRLRLKTFCSLSRHRRDVFQRCSRPIGVSTNIFDLSPVWISGDSGIELSKLLRIDRAFLDQSPVGWIKNASLFARHDVPTWILRIQTSHLRLTIGWRLDDQWVAGKPILSSGLIFFPQSGIDIPMSALGQKQTCAVQ